MEVWNGKPADYSSLRVFGCPVYVMYNSQERTKLDPKSRICIFLGYANNVKGSQFHPDQKQSATIAKGRDHVGTPGAESNSSQPIKSEGI
ncbi:hypothetical protein CR513_39172, partial [Mucuna pruriens]